MALESISVESSRADASPEFLEAHQPVSDRVRIVIVGGGAGGLELATRLGARLRDPDYDIVLVDRNRTHIWKPLLHAVATGSLDASLHEVGYRGHCARWGYRFVYGTMETVDRAARELVIAPVYDEDGRLLVDRHRIPYDYLVLAIGSEANDFGTPGVREHCMVLESHADADRFRNRLLNQCLRVSRVRPVNPANEPCVRVAIVGAGATGVELCAELHHAASGLRHYGLEGFDESRLKVSLIEATPRLLPALTDSLAAAAHRELERLGVDVLTSTRIVSADAMGFSTAEGGRVDADLMLWVAGVKASAILRSIEGLETARNGQLVVRPTLQTTQDERIFAMGDCCACILPGAERPVPPRAQAAHQMADAIAGNLQRIFRQEPLKDFVYQDHGVLVSLSRYGTVGNLMGNLVGGELAVKGRIARALYQSLHAMHLMAIHGKIKGALVIAFGAAGRFVRPHLKLH